MANLNAGFELALVVLVTMGVLLWLLKPTPIVHKPATSAEPVKPHNICPSCGTVNYWTQWGIHGRWCKQCRWFQFKTAVPLPGEK